MLAVIGCHYACRLLSISTCNVYLLFELAGHFQFYSIAFIAHRQGTRHNVAWWWMHRGLKLSAHMITLHGHEVTDLALQYVQCGGKQIMIYTAGQKEMSCSDIRTKGGKGGQKKP